VGFQGVSRRGFWSGFMTGDGSEAWQEWHERRIETVSAPYGPLALVGTHWLEGFPDGRLPAIPGRWTADGDAVVLAAGTADGLTLDGGPFAGEVRLPADQGIRRSRPEWVSVSDTWSYWCARAAGVCATSTPTRRRAPPSRASRRLRTTRAGRCPDGSAVRRAAHRAGRERGRAGARARR
jgi:hypothetical protein